MTLQNNSNSTSNTDNVELTPAQPSAETTCPSPEIWRQIAAGPTAPDTTLIYIKHASQCDLCGPLLRSAVSEFTILDQKLTEEERRHIALLASATVEWQRQLAHRITANPHPAPHTAWWHRFHPHTFRSDAFRPNKFLSTPRLALAGASLLTIALVSFIALHRHELYQTLFQRDQPAFATKLLARAYTEKRTLEFRIAGAAYAPMRATRGPDRSFTDRPTSLSKAEALIATQLESHPHDSAWLQAAAQADLLDGKFDSAVETLRRAIEITPDSPPLLIDLATAYSQRALQENKPTDFGIAYEHLSHALRLSPDDPIALFNRALLAERLQLFHQAIDDWEHCQRVDPDPQWIEAARIRAQDLRNKLNDHHSHATPLLSANEIATTLANAHPPPEVDPRIEEYLQEAVRSWLPQAFPLPGVTANHNASQALFFLADLANRKHNDRWLSDLLQGSSAPNFPQAAAALSHTVQSFEAGQYDEARQQAALTEKLFRSAGNEAATLRALFEQSYAEQMTRHSEDCRDHATAALSKSEKYSYPWLQGQLELEKGVCAGIMNDVGSYETTSQNALHQAERNRYHILYLRALFLSADAKLAAGDRSTAWTLTLSGLQRYWAGQYPEIRGFSLYTNMGFDAEGQTQFNLEVASWREAASILGPDASVLRKLVAYQSLARAAEAAHQPGLAAEQYAEVTRLFALRPHTGADTDYPIELQIRGARLDSNSGQPEKALTRLLSLQDQIRVLTDDYVAQMFYATLGEVQLGRHRYNDAEQTLRSALALAEKSRLSVKSESALMAWKSDSAPVFLALTEAKLLQGNSQEALDTYESYLGASRRGAVTEFSTRSSAPLLARETKIVYASLPDGLAIWVCDDHGVHSDWFAQSTTSLQELAARFLDSTSDPKSEVNSLRRDGRSLYSTLISPIAKRLPPGQPITIEADGWLASVPFEALVDSTNHYLIERWPVLHSVGPDIEAQDQKGEDARPLVSAMPLLAVGSTASSKTEDLIPLTGVDEEADAVATGFQSPRVLKDSEATLRTVKQELPSAAVFHFAGHSLSTPDRSGLLLQSTSRKNQTPSLLDAASVRKLDLRNLRLAVLSACDTESGAGTSDGFNSITEAFLRAGVPHVVASRWAVVETKAFITDFYRNALAGEPVSESTRRASLNMLKDPATAHPYYWSAFAAYGQP